MMTQKFSISLPDEVYEEVKALAEQAGTSVSGYLARLAKQRIDADRESRERLARLTAKDRAADPEGYDQLRADMRARMHAAQRAAAEKKARLA
ncbi:ribbon-helix-helix domain-containing protein [Nonomuraea sp. 3N208]|uniref:ribbon-helix-helix domain-containing protein n=1 Tax=Nonomuraea sp. 3N208 TaxID=3457421 RepID=UPI003FCE6CDC